MEDVWAIAGRVMPRLLVRLRRKMAVTAVFQSNQNDRVTLERHREDIFLAGRSHRDALFPVFCVFFFHYLILFLCSNPTLGAWLPGSIGTPVYRTELMRQPGLSWGNRDGWMVDWLLHITCFFDKSFSSSVNKGLSLHTGCGEESLTQLQEPHPQGVWGAAAHWAVGELNLFLFLWLFLHIIV